MSNGGQLTSVNRSVASIGSGASKSTILVSGPGSSWTMNGALAMGQNGAATLSVLNGAAASCGTAYVGNVSGSAHLAVGGAGARWDVAGDATFGTNSTGRGTLDLQAGAAVTVGGQLKFYSAGTLNVAGASLTVHD